MLILLPPSEGKSSPPRGAPLDLDSLSFDGLTPARKKVLTSLMRTCRGDNGDAMSILGLGPRQSNEIAVNASLRTAPTGRAIEVYTGVLYEALDVATLDPVSRRRLDGMVAISSALFGLLRPSDRIPAYRLSAETTLPGIGPLAAIWKPAVSAELEERSDLVWDLRSAAYAGLGPAPRSTRTITSRILLERGKQRSVVSHHNKATKGRIVRALAEHGGKARTPAQLVDALMDLGFRCEVLEKADKPTRLDVIVEDV